MTSPIASLHLGAPHVAGPLAVFPVFGPAPVLEYRAFAYAIALGAFVKELDEGASVGDLLVANLTDQPLLIFEGEEVLGAQQNRTFDTSVLLAAAARATVPVSCVERGRWDGRRAHEHFRPSAQTADPSLRRTKRAELNLRAAAGMAMRADQGEVWRAVDARMARHAVDSPSDAMHDIYAAKRAELDQLGADLEPEPGQLGAVACVSGRPVALDVVSRPDAFAALLPRLARGYALDALGAPADPPEPSAAEKFLARACAGGRMSQPTPGLGRGLALAGQGVVGGGLEHDGELIQLSAFPAQDAPLPRRGEDAGGRIARPSRRRRGS